MSRPGFELTGRALVCAGPDLDRSDFWSLLCAASRSFTVKIQRKALSILKGSYAKFFFPDFPSRKSCFPTSTSLSRLQGCGELWGGQGGPKSQPLCL